MSSGVARVGWAVAVVLALALVVAFVFRLPCGPGDESASGHRTGARGPGGSILVTGPDRAAVLDAIERAVGWVEQTRIAPVGEGLGRFRFYVIEVRCWYLLWLFEREPTARERFRNETVDRLKLLGDGGPLLEYLRGANIPSLIADLLVLVTMAQDLDVPLPAIEAVLPQLYQAGLNEPKRPPALQIPLAWLADRASIDIGPTVEELRPQGMLRTRPPEAEQKMRDVYYFTHEVFGLTDYGLRQVQFAPEEQAYLERTLPFWSIFHVILDLPDPAAEIAICHQVAGTTHTYGYGEGMRHLVEIQAEDGTFGESNIESADPMDVRLGYYHTLMVTLHALLGHEALLSVGELPGLPE